MYKASSHHMQEGYQIFWRKQGYTNTCPSFNCCFTRIYDDGNRVNYSQTRFNYTELPSFLDLKDKISYISAQKD